MLCLTSDSSMFSRQYQKLVDDLAIARKICYKVPDHSCNTEVQELKVKSYIFLSHAIFEEYIEQITLSTATEALRKFTAESTITTTLVGLISSGIIGRIDEDGISRKLKREPFEDIGLFATTSFGRFKSIVSNNNGIKKDDQLKLLLPVGVDPETEDPATMAALDGFGTKRGNIAHAFKISKAHTLSEIESDVETIKIGLQSFDQACLRNI